MQKTKREALRTLRPIFTDLEVQRREILAAEKRRTAFVYTLLISIAVLVTLCFIYLLNAPNYLVLFFVLLAIMLVAAEYNKSYLVAESRQFERSIGEKIAEVTYPGMEYRPDGHLSAAQFADTGLIGKYEQLHGSHLIRGKHGATSFALSYLRASDPGEGNDLPLFDGLLIIIDLHKHIKGKTIVYPDIAQNRFGTYLGKKIQELTRSAGQQLVYLEDPVFEKAFAVYSTDQIEARYILTPAMMENLLKLIGKYGNRFTFSFTWGKLGVMVREIPRFRVGTDVPLHTEAIFYNFIKPVEMAKDIIDVLNLNTRIWEKS